MQNKRHRHTSRRGAATVELAICLPVLSTIIFGFIEACGLIYATHSLEVAAYESCRMAIRSSAYQQTPGGSGLMTNDQVLAHADTVLTERGIVGGQVNISSNDLTGVNGGEVVTITITAPVRDNSLLPRWFWNDGDLRASAAMVKEANSG